MDLEEALRELEQLDARKARVVELRVFAGLTVPECAEQLGVAARTVDADWAFSMVWLRMRLKMAMDRDVSWT